RDLPPALPAMEIAQAVGPHDPDEIDARIALLDQRQRIGRVADVMARLEGGDDDAGIVGEFLRKPDALGERAQLVCVLEWVARRHHPPELVEPETPQRDLDDQRMAAMRRVER